MRARGQRAELAEASAELALATRWWAVACSAAADVRQRPWLLALPIVAWAIGGKRALISAFAVLDAWKDRVGD